MAKKAVVEKALQLCRQFFYEKEWKPLVNQLSEKGASRPTPVELLTLTELWRDWPALWADFRHAEDADSSLALDLHADAAVKHLAVAAKARGLDSGSLTEAHRLCRETRERCSDAPLRTHWLDRLRDSREAFVDKEVWQVFCDARQALERLEARLRDEGDDGDSPE